MPEDTSYRAFLGCFSVQDTDTAITSRPPVVQDTAWIVLYEIALHAKLFIKFLSIVNDTTD